MLNICVVICYVLNSTQCQCKWEEIKSVDIFSCAVNSLPSPYSEGGIDYFVLGVRCEIPQRSFFGDIGIMIPQ